MIKRAFLTIFLLGLFAVQALAAPKPDDFAYAIPLAPQAQGALYESILPDAVYQTVLLPGFGDLRVFNGADQVVPHTLLEAPLPRPTVQESVTRESGSMPLFPVFEDQMMESGPVSVRIETSNSGAIMHVVQGGEPDTAVSANYYVVDVSSLKWTPNQLHLAWEPRGTGFVHRLEVFASNDLSHWRRATRDAAIADLTLGDHTLVRDRISINRAQGRYLKIQWPKDLDDVRLTLVEAEKHTTVTRSEVRALQRSRSIQGTQGESNEYLFDAGGLFPVRRLQVSLPQPNTVAKGRLYSRNTPQEPWHQIFHGLLYNLSVEGVTLSNESISVMPAPRRHWRLVVDGSGGGLGDGLPVLEMGYQPHRLCFVARGEGPFFLAYGSQKVLEDAQVVDPLLRGLSYKKRTSLMKKATAGTPYSLSGARALEEEPPPMPWRKVLLWGILALGVMCVAIMARRLYKQVDKESESTD